VRHVGSHGTQQIADHITEGPNNAAGQRAEEDGLGADFLDKVADETVGTSTDEILPFLEEKDHPALKMDPLM